MNSEQKKLQQIETMDKYVEKGTLTIDEITFYCLRNHGYSELFVRKYLLKCVELGFFGLKRDGIIHPIKDVIKKEDKKE